MLAGVGVVVVAAIACLAPGYVRGLQADRVVHELLVPTVAGAREPKTRADRHSKALTYHVPQAHGSLAIPDFYAGQFTPEKGWTRTTVDWTDAPGQWTEHIMHGTERSGRGWRPTGATLGSLREYVAVWVNQRQDMYAVLHVFDYSLYDWQHRPKWARTADPDFGVTVSLMSGQVVRKANRMLQRMSAPTGAASQARP